MKIGAVGRNKARDIKNKISDEIIAKAKELKAQGLSYSAIAKTLRISKAGAYKFCNS